MAVSRAVSSHLDRKGLTRSGVPDSAIMRQGRSSSSARVANTLGASSPSGWNEGGEGLARTHTAKGVVCAASGKPVVEQGYRGESALVGTGIRS